MLDRFTTTAYEEAIKRSEENGSNLDFRKAFGDGIDIDLFLMYVSNSFICVPRLKTFFDDLYKTDKIRFYDKARNHELYSREMFSDKNLEMEVSMRRIFGILLCCLEDEELLNKVIKAIEKEYLWMKNLSKKFNKPEYMKKMEELASEFNTNGKSPEAINAPCFIFLFLMFAKKGYNITKDDIWQLYFYITHFDEERNVYELSKYLERLDRIDYTKNLTLTKEFKKFFNACVSGAQICYLIDGAEDYMNHNPMIYSYTKSFNKLLDDACIDKTGNNYLTEKVYRNVCLLSDVLEMNGLSIVELLWNYKTDETERERLLKIISMKNGILNAGKRTIAENINISGFDKVTSKSLQLIENENPELANKVRKIFQTGMTDELLSIKEDTESRMLTSDYVMVFMFDLLAKIVKANRDFYFKNNSETEYYEIQKYQDKTADMELEIEKFNSALSEKDKEIDFLKKQIEDLKNAESKETKDIVKPYNEEISFLNKQVEDLKEKLSAEQEKTDELNKLRTFAFSVRSEDVVAEKEVSLSELIKDKKITIIGGHTNWQNKMKKKYPKLNLLDGHSTSFDLQTLTTSDFVLLYTGNMSHTVYYKMIDTLRTSGVKYDYIGKYNNVNLLEQEIAEILK